MANYQVWNKTKYDIGFYKPGDIGVNVQHGKFVVVNESDVAYNGAWFKARLEDGAFYCEDDGLYEMLGIGREKAIVAQPDDDIIAKLKQPMKGFTAWLKTVDTPDALQKVFDVACAYEDLTQKKRDMIEAATGKSIANGRKLAGLDD